MVVKQELLRKMKNLMISLTIEDVIFKSRGHHDFQIKDIEIDVEGKFEKNWNI